MKIRNLCCHRDLDIAIKCLGSASIYLKEEFRFVIHDDGSLTEEDMFRIDSRIPNSTIIRRSEADSRLDDVTLYRYPHLREARSALPYFLKIADVISLGDEDVVRFVDSDVMFLRPFRDAFCSSNGYDARFMLDARSSYGFRARDYWPLGHVRPVRRVNSGMFWIKRPCIDFDWIEWVCARSGLDQILAAKSWFEQGLWAALAGRCHCGMFDPKQICTAEDQTAIPSDPVALHFNGPARQFFHRYADDQNGTTAEVKSIRTIPSRPYSLPQYALGAIKFRLKRALA